MSEDGGEAGGRWPFTVGCPPFTGVEQPFTTDLFWREQMCLSLSPEIGAAECDGVTECNGGGRPARTRPTVVSHCGGRMQSRHCMDALQSN